MHNASIKHSSDISLTLERTIIPYQLRELTGIKYSAVQLITKTRTYKPKLQINQLDAARQAILFRSVTTIFRRVSTGVSC